MIVQTGLDVLLTDGVPELAGQRVGLITNHTGVDQRLRSAIDRLHASRRVQLAVLFGPEHGVRGDAQAGIKLDARIDSRTNVPVHSLYGATRRPTPEMLAGLDALIFDIQDVGVRYATYISTLAYAQAAAMAAGLQFVVLDRPNPITGLHTAGNLLDPAFASFVGVHPIPIRHGLTVGELARLFAIENGWPEPLVVPMRGWRRSCWFDQTGLPWVLPSPNLPTLESLTLYAGTCLIEGTNVSEGRGTTRPFELIGAPWIDPFELAADLEQRRIAGIVFRAAAFTPMFSKHAGTVCSGVQAHITDRNALQPVALGMHLLHALRALDPAAFAWQQGSDGRYFIDLLFGSDQPRRALEAGATVPDVMDGWAAQAETFVQRTGVVRLYDE